LIVRSTLLGAVAFFAASTLAAPPRAAPLPAMQIAALGNLTPFQAIASETLMIANKGDLTAAQKRGTDLETAWDNAEDKLKPTDPTRWRVVDKAIDSVLKVLRAGQPKQPDIVAALKDLVAIMAKGGAA
jgi:hypothetical protein